MEIKARIDRLISYEGSKVKAIASANIGGEFAIHGIKIIDSEKGLFVQMPQTSYEKDVKRQYSEIFHPITADSRGELNAQILDAYNQKLQEDAQMEESETQEAMQTM